MLASPAGKRRAGRGGGAIPPPRSGSAAPSAPKAVPAARSAASSVAAGGRVGPQPLPPGVPTARHEVRADLAVVHVRVAREPHEEAAVRDHRQVRFWPPQQIPGELAPAALDVGPRSQIRIHDLLLVLAGAHAPGQRPVHAPELLRLPVALRVNGEVAEVRLAEDALPCIWHHNCWSAWGHRPGGLHRTEDRGGDHRLGLQLLEGAAQGSRLTLAPGRQLGVALGGERVADVVLCLPVADDMNDLGH
mmetsp:Transcript_112551/g.297214  ORF Transcript_112551/g.297214 Transcript_112551/m.297214 type:complete len:247 (+) Transcript_112551:313-1053(+)